MSGKSQLIRALPMKGGRIFDRNPVNPAIGAKERTKYVAVGAEWQTGEGAEDPHFRVLDFPGQPEYYATNRLFLASVEEAVVVLCVPLVTSEAVKKVADKKELTAQERVAATRMQLADGGPMQQSLRLWLSELQGYTRGVAEIVLVASFADIADAAEAERWRSGFSAWLEGEYTAKRLRPQRVRGPFLVNCREVEGATAELRRALCGRGREIVAARGEVPMSVEVARDHVLFALRPRNVMRRSELEQELRELPALRQRPQLVHVATSLMVYHTDILLDSERAFVNPQWLAGLVSVLVTPQELGGLRCHIDALPFVFRGAAVRAEVAKCLGESRASQADVEGVLKMLELLDVVFPLHDEFLVPSRMISSQHQVPWELPREIDAAKQMALCMDLEARDGDTMPAMLLGRLLYRFFQLPLYSPRLAGSPATG
jgi:hypothetical protein